MEKNMEQHSTEMLYHKWLKNGKFTVNGLTYKVGVNDHSAIIAMIPAHKKMIGMVCHLSSELTLTNADLDETYHKGFTIGKGKTFYWMILWHKTGHCTVYSRDAASPRYISGDSIITVHFK